MRKSIKKAVLLGCMAIFGLGIVVAQEGDKHEGR